VPLTRTNFSPNYILTFSRIGDTGLRLGWPHTWLVTCRRIHRPPPGITTTVELFPPSWRRSACSPATRRSAQCPSSANLAQFAGPGGQVNCHSGRLKYPFPRNSHVACPIRPHIWVGVTCAARHVGIGGKDTQAAAVTIQPGRPGPANWARLHWRGTAPICACGGEHAERLQDGGRAHGGGDPGGGR